jgi:hypothetical protein
MRTSPSTDKLTKVAEIQNLEGFRTTQSEITRDALKTGLTETSKRTVKSCQPQAGTERLEADRAPPQTNRRLRKRFKRQCQHSEAERRHPKA